MKITEEETIDSEILDIDFDDIRDEFFDSIKSGLSRFDIADGYGYDREAFNNFIDNNKDALKEERRARFQLKKSRMQGLVLKAEKGDMKAIEALDGLSGDAKFKVEFVRGDLRSEDELEQLDQIYVSNLSNGEKK